jgi:hypothetical protein
MPRTGSEADLGGAAPSGWPGPIPDSVRKIPAMRMPQAVEIARELLGDLPKIRERLGNALGMFRHGDSPSPRGELLLRSDLFQDPELALKVMLHEIGHVADWLPDHSMKRGNILGRLRSVLDYLATTAPMHPAGGSGPVSVKERRAIRGRAERETGPRPPVDEEADLNAWKAEVARRYQELVAAEIEARKLASTVGGVNNVRQELLDLTRWWTPGPSAWPDAYREYRESSRELYAEFLSALLMTPGETKARAPKAYEMFFNHLDAKPDVKQAFMDAWAELNLAPGERVSRERARAQKGFADGAAAFERALQERDRVLTPSGWMEALRTAIDSRFEPLLRRERAALAAGRKVPQETLLEWMFEGHPLADNDVFLAFHDGHHGVIMPLLEVGVGQETLGEFLLWNRIAHERVDQVDPSTGKLLPPKGRAVLANPGGETPETAIEKLEAMRDELGPVRWKELAHRARVFHRLFNRQVVVRLHKSGLIGDELRAELEKARDVYAPFTPVKYVEATLSASIRKQIGTFEAVASPFQQAMLKMVSAIRAAEANTVKRRSLDFLKEHFPDEVREAPLKWDGRKRAPVKPTERGWALMVVGEGGRRVGYHVPEEVAAMFEESDHSALMGLTAPIDWLWKRIFYPVFITYNPAFQFIRNPIRDTRRTAVNLPEGLGVEKAVTARIEERKAVRGMVKGSGERLAPEVRKALQARALAAPMGSWQSDNAGVDPFTAMLERWGVVPQPPRSAWDRLPVARVLQGIADAGQIAEATPKVGVFKYLVEDLGWTSGQAAAFVRNHVGTPPYFVRGRWTWLFNRVIPFFNVWLKGWKSDARMMARGFKAEGRKGKSAGSWWLRWFLTSGQFQVLKAAAKAGLLGAVAKAAVDRIGAYWMEKYDAIPIGVTGGGDFANGGDGSRTVFIPVAKDPTDKMLSAMTYRLALAAFAGARGDEAALSEAGEAVARPFQMATDDMPGIHPALKLAGGFTSWLAGRNPYDPFLGREVLSRDAEKLGGMKAAGEMLGWAYNQTGLQSFVRWNPEAETTTEIVLGFVPGSSALVRVSDAGLRERQARKELASDVEAARVRSHLGPRTTALRRELSVIEGTRKENRTHGQEERRLRLSMWESSVVTPTLDFMAVMEERQDRAGIRRLRDQLEESAKSVGDGGRP